MTEQVSKEFQKFHDNNQKMINDVKNMIKTVNGMLEQVKEK